MRHESKTRPADDKALWVSPKHRELVELAVAATKPQPTLKSFVEHMIEREAERLGIESKPAARPALGVGRGDGRRVKEPAP